MNKARASPDASRCGQVFFFFFFFFVNAVPAGLRQKGEERLNAQCPDCACLSCRAVGSLELSPRVGPRKCDYTRMPLVGSIDGCPMPGPPATDTSNGNPARHLFKCAGDFTCHYSICSRSNWRTHAAKPAKVKGTQSQGEPGVTWACPVLNPARVSWCPRPLYRGDLVSVGSPF